MFISVLVPCVTDMFTCFKHVVHVFISMSVPVVTDMHSHVKMCGACVHQYISTNGDWYMHSHVKMCGACVHQCVSANGDWCVFTCLHVWCMFSSVCQCQWWLIYAFTCENVWCLCSSVYRYQWWLIYAFTCENVCWMCSSVCQCQWWLMCVHMFTCVLNVFISMSGELCQDVKTETLKNGCCTLQFQKRCAWLVCGLHENWFHQLKIVKYRDSLRWKEKRKEIWLSPMKPNAHMNEGVKIQEAVRWKKESNGDCRPIWKRMCAVGVIKIEKIH